MALAITIEQDGSLTITGGGAGPGGKGAALAWSVSASQIAAHRRDPAIEAALTPAQKLQCDALTTAALAALAPAAPAVS